VSTSCVCMRVYMCERDREQPSRPKVRISHDSCKRNRRPSNSGLIQNPGSFSFSSRYAFHFNHEGMLRTSGRVYTTRGARSRRRNLLLHETASAVRCLGITQEVQNLGFKLNQPNPSLAAAALT
jgi:hypothetical protein